ATGPNTSKIVDYYLWAQQKTAGFDYRSLGGCGVVDGDPFSGLVSPPITVYCNAGLFPGPVSPFPPARSSAKIDGANAYAPAAAAGINPNGTGLPAVSYTYTVDIATGNLVIHETNPFVKCANATYPPTTVSCASFVSTGVTDHRTIIQDNDGHISW